MFEDDSGLPPAIHSTLKAAAHMRHAALVIATQPMMGAITGKSVSERLSDHANLVEKVYGPDKK